jgi:CHAT domain-containing protein/Tfp pilus assembly protein PilF
VRLASRLLTTFLVAVVLAVAAQAQVTPELRAELGRLFKVSQEAIGKKEYSAARQALEQGLQHAQNAGDGYSVGAFTDALAGVHSLVGQHERAIALGNQALSIRLQLGEKKDIARTLNNLGVYYGAAKQLDRAGEAYLRSMAAWQGAGELGEAARVARALAGVYRAQGQEQKAQDVLIRSIQALEADPKAQAEALLEFGVTSFERGQLDQALTLYQRALGLFQRLGDRKGTGGALNNIALIYQALGQNKTALEHFERSLAFADLSDPKELGRTLTNLGGICLSLGDPEAALRHFNRAVQVEQSRRDPKAHAAALDGLGQAYGTLRQHDKAIENMTKALALVQPTGDLRAGARILGNLGATCKGKGDYAKAVDYLNQSLALKRKYASHRELSASLSNLALIYFDQGKLTEAAAAFSEAIDRNEAVSLEIRDASKVGEYQDWMRSGLYRRHAHVLLEQKKPEDALWYLERGRNRGLARHVSQNRADFGRVLPQGAAQELKDAMTAYNAAVAKMKEIAEFEGLAETVVPAAQRANVLQIRDQYGRAERVLIHTRGALSARFPEYKRLAGVIAPTVESLKALAEKNPDTLYLEWGIGAEATSLLFALSQKDGLKPFILPVGEAELRKQVVAWRAAITESDDPKAESGPAAAIYTALFAEVEKAGLLAPGKYARLVLVGDGPLLEVPFAALLDPSGKRLIERFPISVSVSLGVLTWPDEREKPTSPMLCAADPAYPGAAPLPAARVEGRAVTALFPGASLAVAQQATRAYVLKELPRHGILHFATHGYLDVEDGLKSALVLAPDQPGDTGLLEGRDLINMRLAAQMAVLSACDTGQGRKSGGEGLVGLTWAFRAAGCPSVVASLWSVDDAATGDLMVKFYQALKAGKRKDDALRDAMLEVKAKKADPFFWAAFQVNGAAGPIKIAEEAKPAAK